MCFCNSKFCISSIINLAEFFLVDTLSLSTLTAPFGTGLGFSGAGIPPALRSLPSFLSTLWSKNTFLSSLSMSRLNSRAWGSLGRANIARFFLVLSPNLYAHYMRTRRFSLLLLRSNFSRNWF